MRVGRSWGAAACVAAMLVVVGAAAPAAHAGEVRPGGLTVEHLAEPLGIDAREPRLGWKLASGERGERQTAYQVLVASSPQQLKRGQGDVWDSGRVESDRSIEVPYDGPPLQSGTRYHWKVRVWDRDGDRSNWSPGSSWEMGLLASSDWQGEWIGRPAPSLDLAGAHWIWYPEGDPTKSVPAGTRYFRGRFELPAGRTIERATLTTTADNEVVAYVNGAEVGQGKDWTRATRADVTDQIVEGTNVLAIAARNLGGAGALIGRLRVEFTSGDPLVLDTGSTFKTMDTEQPGWQEPGYDDSDWPAALEAATYGDPPWRSGVTLPRESVTAPVMRKQFTAGKRIVRARAYVSGIGYYELRINGRRIGDRVLEPTYTEYEDTVLYTTYDVAHDLGHGQNTLAVTVAPGFYYYDAPKLLMQVAITYADGSSDVVATDPSWEIADGPTSFDSGTGASGAEVFGGETFDARVEPSDWKPVERVAAPGGRLVAQALEPVKVTETVTPAAIHEPRPGTYVVDMGRTLTGWIRLRAAGPAGSKASIQYGEKLNSDGTVNARANPGPRPRWQRDEYVFRGAGEETWEPSFTFKSFRYVQLDGLAAAPGLDDVRGRVVHMTVGDAGGFSSSSDLYDRIDQAMRRSMLGGMLGYPAIDPAHEKNGWTGDTQLITPSMADNFGVSAYLEKWLGDVRDSQRADGSISVIAPIRDGCCYGWAPEWTAAYPIVAWELYLRYGDRRVLESHYDTLVSFMRWHTGSLVNGISPASNFGDWSSPGYNAAPEDRRLSATAYVYRESVLMADIADALGRDADAASYRATAEEILRRFNEVFLNSQAGRYETASDPAYRQASNAIPLAFGMVPATQEDAVLANLVSDVHARGDHLNTGILGTPALFEALTAGGHADLAHAIAGQTTYPSWGQWLEAGADTMWESWGLGGRSLNHPMLGTVDDWFYRDVAGIEPMEPGYKRTLIEPHPGPLARSRAEHESPYGEIESAWVVAGGRLTLDVRIPVNTSATVRLPEGARPVGDDRDVEAVGIGNGKAEFRVGSGHYRFEAPTG